MWQYWPVGLGNIRLWQQQDPQSVNEDDQHTRSLCHSYKQYIVILIVLLQVCNRWTARWTTDVQHRDEQMTPVTSDTSD